MDKDYTIWFYRIVSMSKTSVEGSRTSPYYLALSDNPCTYISLVILSGENYAEWASELENALRAKCKFGFINGSLKMPDGGRDVEDG